jgi:hypothetical protein
LRGSGAIRISAAITFALLAVYEVLRVAAQGCSGPQCDAYIPISLLVPAAILVAVAVTGGIAIVDARREGGAWLPALAAATVLGVLGPLATAAAFRNQPDTVVALATVLFLLTPLAALIYTFRSSASPAR